MFMPLAVFRSILAEAGDFTPDDISNIRAWYDPSNISSLWQDSARTTPVTASGDPVGCMDDLSGNGFHLIQATSGNRPVYTESGGLKFIRFTRGSSHHLLITAPAFDLSGETFIGMTDRDPAGGVGYVCYYSGSVGSGDWETNSLIFVRSGGNNTELYGNNDGFEPGENSSSMGLAVREVRKSGATTAYYKNGSIVGSAGTTGGSGTHGGAFILGARSDGAPINKFSSIDVHGLILAGACDETTERVPARSWLTDRI